MFITCFLYNTFNLFFLHIKFADQFVFCSGTGFAEVFTAFQIMFDGFAFRKEAYHS